MTVLVIDTPLLASQETIMAHSYIIRLSHKHDAALITERPCSKKEYTLLND